MKGFDSDASSRRKFTLSFCAFSKNFNASESFIKGYAEGDLVQFVSRYSEMKLENSISGAVLAILHVKHIQMKTGTSN